MVVQRRTESLSGNIGPAWCALEPPSLRSCPALTATRRWAPAHGKESRRGAPRAILAEFRRETVRLVLQADKSAAGVAEDLGVNPKTLGNWVRSERAGTARAAEPGALSESEREEAQASAPREPRAEARAGHPCVRRRPISPGETTR